MSNGLNSCSFIGRLGQEPEIKYTQAGKAVANISLAVGESYKDKEGVKQEVTEWVRVVFFGALADICAKYLNKGAQIYVSGKMRTRKWTDNSGQTKYSTEIVAQELRMLGGKDNNQTSDAYSQPQAKSDPIANFNPDTDDIPF